jgi:hypothetical protein
MNLAVKHAIAEPAEQHLEQHRLQDRQETVRWSIDAPPSFWSVGRIGPLILILWAALDVGLRFAPVGWLRLEPTQIATRRPGRFAPFIPNLRLEMNPWIGELAVMGNLRPTETRPPLSFTTDSLGFRNLPGSGSSSARVVVMEGDSFTFGFSLSDNETFPAVLSSQLGVPVYNAGRFATDPERLIEMDWLFAHVRRGPLTVVYILQEFGLPSIDKQHDQKLYDKVGRYLLGADTYTPIKDDLRYAKRFAELWTRISPLRIAAIRADKALNNDDLLPNAYRSNVVERTLPGGGRYLFDHQHLAVYFDPPDDEAVRKAAQYLAALKNEFARRGIDFWVLMLPEGVSVYGPWLFPEETERLRVAGRVPLADRMVHALAEENVRAVNGLEVLRPTAADDVRSGRLSYYREDHHWNVQGVTRLASAMAATLRESGIGQE